jgi:hypothetical protein
MGGAMTNPKDKLQDHERRRLAEIERIMQDDPDRFYRSRMPEEFHELIERWYATQEI